MPSRFNIDFTKDPYYQRGLMLGINEGVSQGISQGEQNIVTRMLEKKFGKLKDSVKKKVRQLSIAEIESLTDTFFEFKTVKDLETWLKHIK